MLDYALEYEIVDRNYARTFELSGDIVKEVEENKQASNTCDNDYKRKQNQYPFFIMFHDLYPP